MCQEVTFGLDNGARGLCHHSFFFISGVLTEDTGSQSRILGSRSGREGLSLELAGAL